VPALPFSVSWAEVTPELPVKPRLRMLALLMMLLAGAPAAVKSSTKVPARRLVTPVYVLVPLRVHVPVPVLKSRSVLLLVPLAMTPLIVFAPAFEPESSNDVVPELEDDLMEPPILSEAEVLLALFTKEYEPLKSSGALRVCVLMTAWFTVMAPPLVTVSALPPVVPIT